MARKQAGAGIARGASREIVTYFLAQPPLRRDRLVRIREVFLHAVSDVQETMRYRMPTFEKDGNAVAIACRKEYLAVYFCAEALIEGVRRRHPELDCGRGCVRVRDTQHVPYYELGAAFARAMRFAQDEKPALVGQPAASRKRRTAEGKRNAR